VFYSRRNARRLDAYRQALDCLPPDTRGLCLGPLLSEASVHANTAGVFKGFYKDRRTGLGKFGGSGGDALSRILGEIRLQGPILSRFECDIEVRQGDANEVVPGLRGLDLAYFDPPYNQHPYGSNYFMLNLLVSYLRPTALSRVSGIPTAWRRSAYNVRNRAFGQLRALLAATDARFLLLSFNSEGFVPAAELAGMVRTLGRVRIIERRYNTFRGSRNLRARPLHVTEHLYLVER
jgi:adenine-specific DNA-methyltransferase